MDDNRRRAVQVLLPALLFPAVEIAGVTNFGLANALLLAAAFVLFTVVFQYAVGGWSD